ncbi:MAG: L-serine ammonia-lyase, iron-sulfur-dependent subunit beta [Candidatus Hodarchaeales archaeon]
MSIFDFIGPIMVGPSSSHTAGALILARVAMNLLGRIPDRAEVIFPRKGSFATSYKGHGSDKAITAGLLGFYSNDPRIKHSMSLAKERNLQVVFSIADFDEEVHPNTIKFRLYRENKEVSMTGVSVGGGRILVTEVLGFPVHYDGTSDFITVYAEDYTGLYVNVLKILSDRGIGISRSNISYIDDYDDFTEDTTSYINIELKFSKKGLVGEEIIDKIKTVPGVIGVRFIPKLKFAEDHVL